jgi:AcrR family transcriptional regulator
MPRASRTEEEVEVAKKRIINIAMEILYEDGFENLSMRKIGTRLGMTAANIYNYFSNKDELYIEMRRYSFLELYDRLDTAYRAGQNLEDRTKNLIREYVRFGLEEVFAYEMMFVMRVPSYNYYKNTPLEEIANREMESSLRVFDLILRCARELLKAGYRAPTDESTAAISLWTHLHGAISLHNNKLMNMVTEDPSKIMESLVNYQYALIFNILQNPALADVEIE